MSKAFPFYSIIIIIIFNFCTQWIAMETAPTSGTTHTKKSQFPTETFMANMRQHIIKMAYTCG